MVISGKQKYKHKASTLNNQLLVDLAKPVAALQHACCAGLQAQSLSDATLPMGPIHPFRKISVTFEPMVQF